MKSGTSRAQHCEGGSSVYRTRHKGPFSDAIEQDLRHRVASYECGAAHFLHLDRGLLRACIGCGQAGQGHSQSSSFADYRGWIVGLGDLHRPGAVECVRSLFPSSEGRAETKSEKHGSGLYMLSLHAPTLFRRAWGIAGERCVWVCHARWGIWLTPSIPIVTARPCSSCSLLLPSFFVGVDATRTFDAPPRPLTVPSIAFSTLANCVARQSESSRRLDCISLMTSSRRKAGPLY
jgi:hypothetical protein